MNKVKNNYGIFNEKVEYSFLFIVHKNNELILLTGSNFTLYIEYLV